MRAELERHDAAGLGDHPPHALGGALAHRPRRPSVGAGKSMPLMRVWAVNGTMVGVAGRPAATSPKRSLANSTIERPSGVSSARLDAERGLGELVVA